MVRVVTGALFVRHGLGVVQGQSHGGDALESSVRAAVEGLSAPLRAWGNGVLLKNPEALSMIVGWGALVAGAMLFAGAFTRAVGWIAAFLALNGAIYSSPGMGAGYFLAALCCAACAISAAGNVAGLDPMLGSVTRKGDSFLD